MIDFLKTILNTRVLIFCLFIMLMGLSAGIFFGGIVPVSEKMHLADLLNETVTYILPTLLVNIAGLTLILLAGFSVYGFPLALIILFSRSFAVGFCDSLLLYNVESNNIVGFIFNFMIPQLLLCTLYLTAVTCCVSYALHKLNTGRS